MEVETRPPLVDGRKLGLHARSTSPDLSLSITENDILSDEEQELLRSPGGDCITCVKDTSVNGGLLANGLENVSREVSCESAKCNGDISSDSVSDAANVFRTEIDCVSVCAKEIGEIGNEANPKSRTEVDEDAYSEPNCKKNASSQKERGLVGESDIHAQECSQSLTGTSSTSDGPCEDVSGTDVIVEDPCSLDASELHIEDKQDRLESSKAEELDVHTDLSNTAAEGTSSVELSVDVKPSNELEVEGIDEVLSELSDHLLDSGLSPKSLKDFGDDLDEMEIPRVIDISSICGGKENKSEPTSVVAFNEVDKDQTTTAEPVEENTVANFVEVDIAIAASDVVDESAASDVDKPPESELVDEGSASDGVDGAASSGVDDAARSGVVDGVAESGVDVDSSVVVLSDSQRHVEDVAISDRSVPPAEVSVASRRDDEIVGKTEVVKVGEVDHNEISTLSERDEETVETTTDEGKQNELVGKEVVDDVALDENDVTGAGMEVDEALGSSMPDADESTEAEFPAEETLMDYNMDVGQEEDGSPGYQGMTEDILPIIESELDDMPEGEGNIFDTEVECEESGGLSSSVLDEMEDTQDGEAFTNLAADNAQDIDVDTPSHQVRGTSQTEECGDHSTKRRIEHFSSSDRVKLKRRASADFHDSPPVKIIKRQCSLDNLDECAERFDRQKSFDEFKKLSGKKLPAPPANISAEPLDIPIDIDENIPKPALVPTKKRKTAVDGATISSSSVDDASITINAEIDPSRPASECSGKPMEQSMLVIDLDDDDEKPENDSSPSISRSPFEKQEPSKSAPRSALDILFNGKKEITLNRKMFTRVMKSYVSQYLLTFSDLGQATSLSLKANNVLSKIQSSVSSYEKQKEDFKSIMNKLLEDRQARKTWDETVVPPRATRSVGLQVCSVGSMYMKNGDNEETLFSLANKTSPRSKVPSSSANQSQALAQQKQAFAQQQMAMAQSRAKKAESTPVMRPIAKKSVTPANRPMVVKTVLAAKPVTPINVLAAKPVAPINVLAAKPVTPIKPKPSGPQFPTTTPKLNGLKAVTVTRNPDPLAKQNTTPLTVTTVSPNSRTFTLSSKGTFALKSPQKTPAAPQPKQYNTTLSKGLISIGTTSRGSPLAIAPKGAPQNTSKAVPIAVTHTPGTVQNSKHLASGPGRPGKTTAPISTHFLSSPAALTSAVCQVMQSWAQVDNKAKKPASAVLDTTIDLTDLDDDVPQPTKPSTPHNTTARKSTAPSRVAVPAKVPPISSKQMRHPALPPNPPNFNPTSAPPRPYLGICDTQAVTQGIMLTWHFNNILPLRKISKFQVFAYQETKGDGEDTWKKVGDVDALPLPMACTLTQFREGYTYHFIVRALDEVGHVGPFSAPNTITLMKKTV